MLVQFHKRAQARRAELDGYGRTGDKAIEAPMADLSQFLSRDDVSVRKVVLDRDNGEDEAEIIDREIRKHSGTVKYEYPAVRRQGAKLETGSSKMFEVSEQRMTIRRRFRDVVSGDYSLRDPDDKFEDRKQQVVDTLNDKIAELEEERDRVADLTPDELFDDE